MPHIATTSFWGDQCLPLLGLALKKHALQSEEHFEVSVLGRAFWIFYVFFYRDIFLFVCFAHNEELHILDEETHLSCYYFKCYNCEVSVGKKVQEVFISYFGVRECHFSIVQPFCQI